MASLPFSFAARPLFSRFFSTMRLLSVTAALACAGLVLAQDAAQAPFASPLNAEHEAAIQQGAEQHGYTVGVRAGRTLC